MDVGGSRMGRLVERMDLRVFDYASWPVMGADRTSMIPKQPFVWFWSLGARRLGSVAN